MVALKVGTWTKIRSTNIAVKFYVYNHISLGILPASFVMFDPKKHLSIYRCLGWLTPRRAKFFKSSNLSEIKPNNKSSLI